jgi:hypothetical protein
MQSGAAAWKQAWRFGMPLNIGIAEQEGDRESA